jgi:hypothetical protein
MVAWRSVTRALQLRKTSSPASPPGGESMDAVEHIDKMRRVSRTYAERFVDMTPLHRPR